MLSKLSNGFLAANAIYAFYRGWNKQFGYDTTPTTLYTDKFAYGINGLIRFGNPFLLPVTTFYALRRAEKWSRGISIDKEDYEW